MQRWLVMAIGGLVALALPALPAHAQDTTASDSPAQTSADADAPIPRQYPEASLIRARPSKPADQYAREEAAANEAEAACKAGTMAACAKLGRAFHYGEGRPQSRPVAELIYRKACTAAQGAACFGLGNLIQATREPSDDDLAALFHARACRLGVLEGCEAEADNLEATDPKAAEALRRTTCTAGSTSACRTLASRLIGRERSEAERAEGLALQDRLCRANDQRACSDMVFHWRGVENGNGPRTLEYYTLACNAGEAWSCLALGRNELDRGPERREAAQAFYDRACTQEAFACEDAKDLRAEPQLIARCETGDASACTAYAAMISGQSQLREIVRPLALLGASCEAGNDAVCLSAARLVFEQWQQTATPDPDRAALYLDRSCAAGTREACELLADELAEGNRLPQDTRRATELYFAQCETGRMSACRFIEQNAATDPSAPLALASASFMPELTPEEEEADRRERREAIERQRAEDRAEKCTTTTAEWEGVIVTDTLCDNVQRVIGQGFIARRGEAPWQALLWRPAVLQTTQRQPGTNRMTRVTTQLTPDQRVLCGGSVIREGWVLTAAHCLNDSGMGGISVRDGGHRIRLGLTRALGDEGFSYPIIATYRHPAYDPKLLAFDIALVQYDPARGTGGKNAIAPARVRLDPVPLPLRRVETLSRVATYGWGLTAVRGGVIPDQLRGGRVKLRDTATCTKDTAFTDAKRRDSVLCADLLASAADGGQACSGDSGGPLISYSDPDKVPTLIGVVSGGVECGTLGKPSRYIRVAHPRVQQWLKEVLPPAAPRQPPARAR